MMRVIERLRSEAELTVALELRFTRGLMLLAPGSAASGSLSFETPARPDPGDREVVWVAREFEFRFVTAEQ